MHETVANQIDVENKRTILFA